MLDGISPVERGIPIQLQEFRVAGQPVGGARHTDDAALTSVAVYTDNRGISSLLFLNPAINVFL